MLVLAELTNTAAATGGGVIIGVIIGVLIARRRRG